MLPVLGVYYLCVKNVGLCVDNADYVWSMQRPKKNVFFFLMIYFLIYFFICMLVFLIDFKDLWLKLKRKHT